MNIISQYKKIKPFTTLDGSEIRELMHPNVQGNKSQSLAEAIIKPEQTTVLHRHIKSEELYFILQGEGKMQLEDKIFMVSEGDTICIPPGTNHCIENIGKKNLKILCCCSPAYADDDTEII